jgi:hypothetical protein
VCTTDSKHCLPVAANLLEQNFVAHRPGQVWLADITYIPTSEGWLYLAVIFDLFTRTVVGWAILSTCVPNSPSPCSSWQSNGAARERASSIIPIAAANLGSNGRRNTWVRRRSEWGSCSRPGCALERPPAWTAAVLTVGKRLEPGADCSPLAGRLPGR